ncbi:MAG: class I SAM-dependent methyltransferase [Paludibacteraceae bacterium]|nr:class I SAM-dependent methyltransferase [Paludibacteraceae bacterium]
MGNLFWYRTCAWIKHRLTAWNTTGEGIHSPWLFRLVRFVLRDENSFYCFSSIERRRQLLLSCHDELSVTDYGSAGSPEGTVVRRKVSDIAARQLESKQMGQLLFRVVHFLGGELQRPLEILELGTSLGITTAYLASPASRNRVMTLEGSRAVLRVAQGVWKALKTENIEWGEGRIDDTLYKRAREKLDVVFMDANHTYEATLRYADYLLPRMTEKGIIVIDDIHYSPEMERAWEELKTDPRVTSTIDLYHVGMLFVDPHYLKRHYRVRV